MAAYIIARISIHEPQRYTEYTKRTPPVLHQYGGRFVARGSDVTTLEGPTETRRIVVLEFADADSAKAFYFSPEYTEIRAHRDASSDAEFIIVEGYPEEEWAAALAASQAVP
ncbi:MAG: DUF1330 domain-containing protein [Chthonomonas sp.]|nr:DUF1330 domain-containing protein [Chthonomonas sp.]